MSLLIMGCGQLITAVIAVAGGWWLRGLRDRGRADQICDDLWDQDRLIEAEHARDLLSKVWGDAS